MFACCDAFDSLLLRKRRPKDSILFEDLQKLLKTTVVGPLRRRFFVNWKSVMKIRKVLAQLSSDSGMTSDEKDPDELLHLLFDKVFSAESFLRFSTGQESYLYQLFVQPNECQLLPTVQQLFEQSCHSNDVRLSNVPSVLLLQLPRYGREFKSFQRYVHSDSVSHENSATSLTRSSSRLFRSCAASYRRWNWTSPTRSTIVLVAATSVPALPTYFAINVSMPTDNTLLTPYIAPNVSMQCTGNFRCISRKDWK
jgi:hypothetical protein